MKSDEKGERALSAREEKGRERGQEQQGEQLDTPHRPEWPEDRQDWKRKKKLATEGERGEPHDERQLNERGQDARQAVAEAAASTARVAESPAEAVAVLHPTQEESTRSPEGEDRPRAEHHWQ